MSQKKYSTKLFYKYYLDWIHIYKDNAVRQVTLDKYYLVQKCLKELAPDLHMNELNRRNYQQILNLYARNHEKTTTLDFHHHLKASLFDAVDDGLLKSDPTRRAIIKGCSPSEKKIKYLNLFDLQKLLRSLDLNSELNWDWFFLLIAKTGLRFAEALALTKEDFDFEKQRIIINKSWNYKEKIGHFQPTKNESSNRTVMVDWQLMQQFQSLIRSKEDDQLIFFDKNQRVYNSTLNQKLATYCEKLDIPIISIHGLRHTHASLLLYEGVSIASVAKRLGHSNTTTTQETYIHIIRELENKDNDKVLHHLSQLG
ncbi:site-specific integrase [Lactobacillus taiwanensis]|uniref:Site-specific integrase n=2 Tax=Lactobacillus taiwanensis TaxID=508451 RepID=A0A256LHI7_9LACO|nr:site-specific integrase [Lactobacillus taiwanensis]OYR88710.1 site-specific integrase [Lactobacillus taiwanensis]OYR90480.1 site-specific integrase [Lactobacillus taiwanensis]OYR92864.1 site-specific integrase [Lactobacillus taiwanensis]OYR95413.1 site-specific integrase [Lactobacillus taiwanensis]OYR95451.1 site-specific integrase [Lactobacillus taiwanensis]